MVGWLRARDSEPRQREKQRIRGWVRWRERGRHKGVDKVAIAHGTQLHASPRALSLFLFLSLSFSFSLSLSSSFVLFLPPFAPPSSSFSSLDRSTHTLLFSSPLLSSLLSPPLFSSLLFSLDRHQHSHLRSEPLPLFGFPGTVHNRFTPNLPLSPGKLRRDDSKQEISQTTRRQRCSCREFLACPAVSTNFDSPFAFSYRLLDRDARSVSRISFPFCPSSFS